LAQNKNDVLKAEILDLKQQRNAVILAHNYQRGEVQDIADFVGDSLDLSQNAAKTDADVIVFCGVHFMAETAVILSPKKVVLLPDANAGCPMADMITAERLIERKNELNNARVVCYVNSSAAVKAESDVCCTSANGVKVVRILDSDEILFVPDENLGKFVSLKTGKRLHLWTGFCPTHMKIKEQHIIDARQQYPDAKVIVHPECRPEVIALADQALSTSGMCTFARETEAREVVIGTEVGILYRLRKENPQKRFIAATEEAICPTMKLITLEKIMRTLQRMEPRVQVPEIARLRAHAAVDRMIEIGR